MNRRELEAVADTLGTRLRGRLDAADTEAAALISGLAGEMAARLADADSGFDQDAFRARVRASAGTAAGREPARLAGDARFGPDDIAEIDQTRAFLLAGHGRGNRRRAGITRGEAAAACGVADSTVSTWEVGTAIPEGQQALDYGRLLAARQPPAGPPPGTGAETAAVTVTVPDDATRDAVLASLVTIRDAAARLGTSYQAVVARIGRGATFPGPVLGDGSVNRLYWWPDILRRTPGHEAAAVTVTVPDDATRDAVLASLVTITDIAARTGVETQTVVGWPARHDDFPAPVLGTGTRNRLYWWPDILRYRLTRQSAARPAPRVPRPYLDAGGRAAYASPGPHGPLPAAGWTVTHEEYEAGYHLFQAVSHQDGSVLGEAYLTEMRPGPSGEPAVEVEWLRVTPASRRQGAGTSLLAGIDAQFPGRVVRIPASPPADAEPGAGQLLRDFCRRLGFTGDHPGAAFLARRASPAGSGALPAGSPGGPAPGVPGNAGGPADLSFAAPWPSPVPPGSRRRAVVVSAARPAGQAGTVTRQPAGGGTPWQQARAKQLRGASPDPGRGSRRLPGH